MTYEKLVPILEMIHRCLSEMENVYAAMRVTDVRNKTVEKRKRLKYLGLLDLFRCGEW